MRHVKLYWDPDRQGFMDEGGFEIWPYDLQEILSVWTLNLIRHMGSHGSTYWSCTSNGYFIEVFWPDEEAAENWYL